MKNKKLKKLILLLAVIVPLLTSYVVVSAQREPDALPKSSNSQQDSQSQYGLLSKRIFVDNPSDFLVDFGPLRKQIEQYISEQVGGDNVSLYFEYLPSGTSFDAGKEEDFVPASLMKIPKVMDLYKASEAGKVDLDKKMPLKIEWLNSEFGSLYKQGAGYEISLREAAKYTLAESDNTAVNMIESTLVDLGLEKPEDSSMSYIDLDYLVDTQQGNITIDAPTYSSVLKCLYLSCYLKVDDSQEILEYLTQSTFNDRLTAYIPTSTKVAHKIGTFNELTQSDCGIVYQQGRNYLLCVMINGPSQKSSEHISVISRMTYRYVESIGR